MLGAAQARWFVDADALTVALHGIDGRERYRVEPPHA